MMMPSIALPTGPYDWRPEKTPRSTFEQRIASLRTIMKSRGITHCVVHGNGFDHAALHSLSHFTPKLGPAYLLVSPNDALRMLFAGGPGMRPSAQALTWVEDVAALRGIEKDVQLWLAQTSQHEHAPVGLIAGRAMLRGDWLAVERAAGTIALLDDDFKKTQTDPPSLEASIITLKQAAQTLFNGTSDGGSQRQAVLRMERAAYEAGAQDVRIRMARRVWGAPVVLPDEDIAITGPTPVALAVRTDGLWISGRFVVGPVSRDRFEEASNTAPDPQLFAVENSVGIPDRPANTGAVAQAFIRLPREPQAIWSLIVTTGEHERRRILWAPPGLTITPSE